MMWTADKERRLEELTDRFNQTCQYWIDKLVDSRTRELQEKLDQEKRFNYEIMQVAFKKYEYDWLQLQEIRQLMMRGPKKKG